MTPFSDPQARSERTVAYILGNSVFVVGTYPTSGLFYVDSRETTARRLLHLQSRRIHSPPQRAKEFNHN